MPSTTRLRRFTTLRDYLSPITSKRDRAGIFAAYRLLCDGKAPSPTNFGLRERLHDAIFSVEDELESRDGGRPYDRRVIAMRSARNRVGYDIGWNDIP